MEGQHGFARNVVWKLEKKGDQRIVASLEESSSTLDKWPHKFALTYIVSMENDSLKTEFVVRNNGDVDFHFTSLLHTYFRVNDIEAVQVKGFHNLSFKDKLQQSAEFKESAEYSSIKSEVDRCYLDAPSPIELKDATRKILIEKSASFPDVVLWNPWIEKSKAMADFDDEEVSLLVNINIA